MADLQWISEGWLTKKESDLVHVAKTKRDGSPNPNYTEALRVIEAAHYHLDTKNRIIEKAASAGYVPNKYSGTCVKTGVEVGVRGGFVRKNQSGKWETISRGFVIEELGIDVSGLPAC